MQGRSDFTRPEAAAWTPGPEQLQRSRLAAAMKRWGHASLEDFHRASVEQPDWFWAAAAQDLGIVFQGDGSAAVRDDSRGHEFPRWFPRRTFNIVWSCLERHAQNPRTAHKNAVVYEGDSGQRRAITYAQLQEQVDVFAGALRSIGIGKGDRVTLFMPPLPEAAVAVLGCAKIGAVIVPAFTGYGSDALATRLQACEASLLITVDSTTRRGKTIAMKATADAAAAASPSVQHMFVVRSGDTDVPMQAGRDHDWSELAHLAAGRAVPTEALDPNDPLYILYTSGTTGAPKGIVHSHVGLLMKTAIDLGYAWDIQEDDVIAWITDLGWMLGPLLLTGGLHLGATLVLIEGVPDYPRPDRLWQIAERNRATFFGISPTAARGLRSATDGARPDADLGSLRAFASTGEAWDLATWHWLFETIGNRRLPILNYCGGTEVGGGIVSGYTIAPHAPASFCGPLPGMDVDVYDTNGKPTSEIGEIVVLNTWPGMAHSFWHDDRRFLATYWQRWKNVWVHGDLASIDASGTWRIHGRSDDTLKIGGRRVGPAEIESALVAQPGVAEAGVIGAPHDMKGQVAVAFVVPRPGATLDQDALRQAMTAAVGKGMLPEEFHIVPALPKTKNGKILRRAIRARYLGDPVGDMSSLDPMTPLESIPVKP